MSNDRDKILSAIRSALDPLPERQPYPEWDDALPITREFDKNLPLKEAFASKLEAIFGQCFDNTEKMAELLRSKESTFGYCDPDLAYLLEGLDGITFETEFNLAKVDDYTFGITRASCAVAESGTVVLKDTEHPSRLGALAPWIHVAVVEEKNIVGSIQEAISQFGDDPYVVFCTGPSKTADVEGILIKGVHGPGVQVALII